MVDKDFFSDDAVTLAQKLLGCVLTHETEDGVTSGIIIETEAYSQEDAASHSCRGETERTKIMFGPGGHAYVYFTYGMHYCFNVVVGPAGHGAAVLIRAVEPLEGEDYMTLRRNRRNGLELTNGPAKLCQALVIDRALNGHDLHRQPLQLIKQRKLPSERIIQTTRIGISRAKDVPWRFYITNNPYVSKL